MSESFFLAESRTAATAASTTTILQPRAPTATSASSLVRVWDTVRQEVGHLGASVVDGHRAALAQEIDARAARHSQKNPSQLLERLAAGRGLSWTAMARMLGVTLSALRKWRKGESISGENRGGLARLVAFLDLLVEKLEISDPASWLEIPILKDVPLTRVDVYATGRTELLLELAQELITPESLLDQSHPGWRTDHPLSRWEVFRAADGDLSVREKPESSGSGSGG